MMITQQDSLCSKVRFVRRPNMNGDEFRPLRFIRSTAAPEVLDSSQYFREELPPETRLAQIHRSSAQDIPA